MAELFAGTSGFAYPQWKPEFYPPKLPAKQFLQHYASRLNSGLPQLNLSLIDRDSDIPYLTQHA